MPPPAPAQGRQPQQPTNADIVKQLSSFQSDITKQLTDERKGLSEQLSQHKQDVFDRLAKQEQRLEDRLTKQDDVAAANKREQESRIEEVRRQVSQVSAVINGGVNPTTGAFDPTSGLLWNMTEVKRFFSNTRRFMWLVITALLGTVGTLIVDLVVHLNHWGK